MGTEPPHASMQTSAARALRVVFYELRAPGLTSARRATLLSESLHQLTVVLEAQGPLEARIRVDGVYLGDECVVATNPEEDAQAFAIFQHGLRRVAFLPGLEREELEALVGVLSTDPKTLDPREEDLITLLGRHDLVSIHFVVIETFVEGEGDSEEQVQEVISAGTREKVFSYESSEEQGSASVRIWEADQRLLEGDELARLAEALPGRGQGGTEGSLGDELSALREKLVSSLEHSSPFLPAPALHLAHRLDPEVRERLARLVAHELLHEARTHEPAAFADSLAQAVKWRDEAKPAHRPGPDAAQDMAGPLFAPAIEELSLDVLTHEPVAGLEAARALAKLPLARHAALLPRLAALPASAGRDRALTALCRDDAAGVAEVAQLLPSADESCAAALVQGLRRAPLGEVSLDFFRQLLTERRPRMRARAVGWFQAHAPDHAVGVLGERLRKGEAVDKLGALAVLLGSRGPLARTLVLAFLQSKEFAAASFEVKRLTMLAFLEAAGSSAVPYLQTKAEEMALRGYSRETRAAAVAALGATADEESRELLEQLSESRSAGHLVVEEAQKALAGFDAAAGRPPASDAIEHELRERGVWMDLRASERTDLSSNPASGPASAAASQPASLIPGFSVASSTLCASPPSAPPPGSHAPLMGSHHLAESDALRAPALPEFEDVLFAPPSEPPIERGRSSHPPSRRRSSARSLAETPVEHEPSPSVSLSNTAETLPEIVAGSLRPPAAGGEERLGTTRASRHPSSKPTKRSQLPACPVRRVAEPHAPTPPSAPAPAPNDLAAMLEAYVTERPPPKAEHE